MSVYEVPDSSFNANEWARNKAIASNQFRNDTINRYKQTYEKFWDLTVEPSGRSQEQYQQILNEMGTTALSILSDSATYVASLNANWSGVLPTLYHTAPYPYTVVSGTLQLTGGLVQPWLDEIESRNNPDN